VAIRILSDGASRAPASSQVWQHLNVLSFFCGRTARLVVLLLLLPLSALARGETRQVLVLSSSERPFAPQSGFADALMRDLIRLSREPIQFVEVSVQAARASGEAPDVSAAHRIRSAFHPGRLDLVVTIGGPAATFAQRFRRELFPDTPTLIAGVDRRFVEHGTFSDSETVVATQHDPAAMIDEVLRLRPATRTVLVVIGSSHVEQFWLKEMKREFGRFGDRLQFIWTNDLSFAEILERCRTMPDGSAIFFALLSLDGKGEPRVGSDTLTALHAVANVPIFALYGMGEGIVGGPMLSTDDLSRTTAQVALRVLAGESPATIKTPTQRTGQPTYDARELRRWNIDERRLPPASVVLFRAPTGWQRYGRPITFGALFVGIPVVAIVLLVGVIGRRRTRSRGPLATEVGSAGDIATLGRARAELSNLSRSLMQAHDQESAALARKLHEDVCQRMVALTLRLHNVPGADNDGELADIRAQLGNMVGEIAEMSKTVHQRLELLGLSSASREFCKELSSRHNLPIHFQDDGVPRDLLAEIALALFRALQEATVNAVMHSSAREVWVSIRSTAAEVRLQVLDRGVGFDPQRAAANGGVGLVAMRERLKLVNGDSVIVSRSGEGTRVDAWVPITAGPLSTDQLTG
jgi:signal transduction histidine kinase